ncbi:MAG: bifunctional DNA-formamidopyrimidine glycosylase/DNA-(apurinic or apyrimidinic site) lyase [Candidatus Zixiibacteriota bacterium]|nr:MAG: bifunctional DNA-formamidopyrimidine glycosylase/DNA-(apurinic or apyrimidinic site) lyase [candidate division Zixibacteria bacterium]
MPELPEVETVARGLRDTVLGRTIARVRLKAPPGSTVVSPAFGQKRFERILRGRTILDVRRRGKNILLALSGDATLWVHLKMTGHFYYLRKTEPVDRHDLVVIDFKAALGCDNGKNLRFNDYRRFGRLRLYRDDELWQQRGLGDLGPEPLEMSSREFLSICRRSSRMIKPALLDQTFVAGLGNIYADESLHAARIHPRRATASISSRKLLELHHHIQRLLKSAINKMGTSVDSYAGVNGQPGRFQKYLRVYGREGLPCKFCGRAVVREKVGSRSAHFCPRCQRP